MEDQAAEMAAAIREGCASEWTFEQAVNLWGILPAARFIERPPAED